MDTHKEAKIIHQVYDKDGGAALILHQKVYVFVNNFHFFLCYFRTTVVLRFSFVNVHLKLNWMVLIINSLLL